MVLLLRRPAGGDTAQLQGRVEALANQLVSSLEGVNRQLLLVQKEVSDQVDQMKSSVRESLDRANKEVSGVQVKLAETTEMVKQVHEVAKDIAKLQDILRPPKPRGALGELMLEELLNQVLPTENYKSQYAFRNGEVVDAVIFLHGGLVPVDSKFPLESFAQLLACETDEERKAARRKFADAVRKHIDAIAAKYIRPEEGTFPFALMYVPAENVYYETIVKEEAADAAKGLYEYALGKKVFPVSPHTFYAYLHAIALGLRGLEIEKNAAAILGRLEGLGRDFAAFEKDFTTLGSHVKNAATKYEESQRKLDRFGDHLEQLSSGAQALPERAKLPEPGATEES